MFVAVAYLVVAVHKPHLLAVFQAAGYVPVVATPLAAVRNRPLGALQAVGYAPVFAEPHVVAHTPAFGVEADVPGLVVTHTLGDCALGC